MNGPLLDGRDRPLADLRVSLTDRCNLRCTYCMPEPEYVWLPRDEILSFEEIATLVSVFVELGVEKVRLTGGEPLLRRDVPALVRLLAANRGLRDLPLTTNGTLLAAQAQELRDAGLTRVTVSLDTLRPARFAALTRRDEHAAVLDGLRAVTAAGFSGTKIDTVVMRGLNEDELVELVEFARTVPAEIRFIEYMDVGGATRWAPDAVVSRDEILWTLESHYGPIVAAAAPHAAPARRYLLPDGTTFGIVASTTTPFCGSCDRSRLTADGTWYRCLYAPDGTDLRSVLRAGAGRDDVRAVIASGWRARRDQGAVDRLRLRDRRPLLPVTVLQTDPHLEMHTRGG